MRLAGGAAIHEALAKYFDANPHACGPAPSRPVAPELTTPGGGDHLDSFLETFALLRSKGYSEAAASDLAQAAALGESPMPAPTLRFAAVYGHPSRHAYSGE